MDRNRLIEIYKLWVSRHRANPAEFTDIGTVDEFAERSADYFLELLAEVNPA